MSDDLPALNFVFVMVKDEEGKPVAGETITAPSLAGLLNRYPHVDLDCLAEVWDDCELLWCMPAPNEDGELWDDSLLMGDLYSSEYSVHHWDRRK